MWERTDRIEKVHLLSGHTARREGEIRIRVRRLRVSRSRSHRREIPRLESSGSWDPDVRRGNEGSPSVGNKDRTSGQKTPGSVVIRMDRRIIRCHPGAATENQRRSGEKSREPGAVRAART